MIEERSVALAWKKGRKSQHLPNWRTKILLSERGKYQGGKSEDAAKRIWKGERLMRAEGESGKRTVDVICVVGEKKACLGKT